MSSRLVKGSGCGTREWRETFALTDTDGTTNKFSVDTSGNVVVAGSLTRTAQQYQISAQEGKVGATAGWVVTAGTDKCHATLPASQTGSTLVIPISGLKVGWTITGFHLAGQIESAGNTVTLDADLRALTAAAADNTDASIGAMTQVSVTADTLLSSANTSKSSLTEVVAVGKSYYLLITATTAAATDIDLMSVVVTVSEA